MVGLGARGFARALMVGCAVRYTLLLWPSACSMEWHCLETFYLLNAVEGCIFWESKNKFSLCTMVTKKSVKNVDISDDGVLNLKSRERSGSGFTVHKIQDEMERVEVPIDRYNRIQSLPPVQYPQVDVQQRMESFAEKLEQAVVKVSPAENNPREIGAMAEGAKELIKVKFDKFVTLVASRDFLSVMEKNKDEDIIMSSNLLTDLAGSMEEKSEKKTPVIFLVGLAIGVIVTYLLINR